MQSKIVQLSKVLFTALLCAATFSAPVRAQNKESEKLKKERNNLEKEINSVSGLLKDARSTKEKTFNELQLLKKQVTLHEQLVGSMNREVRALETEILTSEAVLVSLEDDLKKIRGQLAHLIYLYYKTSNYQSSNLFLLSAESISQAANRMRYFRDLAHHIDAQKQLVLRTQNYIITKQQELLGQKTEKETLIEEEKVKTESLVVMREEQAKLHTQLRTKEAEYKKQLADLNKELITLNQKIEKAIQAELAKASGGGAAAKEKLFPLSKAFADNKGKLPWPLPSTNGVITTHFGKTTLESGTEINVNGIDISTTANQPVRAVFEGTVLEISELPLRGYMVIVGHGTYFTVYTNMKSVSVQKGAAVKALDNIGIAKTDKSSGETKVHFQIFNEKTPQDPENWISRKAD